MDCADTQAGLCLCCSHAAKIAFLATRPTYNGKTEFRGKSEENIFCPRLGSCLSIHNFALH